MSDGSHGGAGVQLVDHGRDDRSGAEEAQGRGERASTILIHFRSTAYCWVLVQPRWRPPAPSTRGWRHRTWPPTSSAPSRSL